MLLDILALGLKHSQPCFCNTEHTKRFPRTERFSRCVQPNGKRLLECSLCDNFLARYADSRQLATPGLSNPLRHISPSEVSPAPVWRHQACAGWATAYPTSIQGLMEESTWHCLFAHSRMAPVSRGRWRSASHPRGHGADPRIRPPSRLERRSGIALAPVQP